MDSAATRPMSIKGNKQISRKLPIIVYLIEKYLCSLSTISPKWKRRGYVCSVWLLTFMAYLLFHLCRMPTSVIKGTLKGQCNKGNNTICDCKFLFCYCKILAIYSKPSIR